MEITQIVNITLYTLVAVGFVSYIIWLGFSVVSVKRKLEETINNTNLEVDDINRYIDSAVTETHRSIDSLDIHHTQCNDRLDSRLDFKITELERNLITEIDSTSSVLQSAIDEMHLDIDKLNSINK